MIIHHRKATSICTYVNNSAPPDFAPAAPTGRYRWMTSDRISQQCGGSKSTLYPHLHWALANAASWRRSRKVVAWSGLMSPARRLCFGVGDAHTSWCQLRRVYRRQSQSPCNFPRYARAYFFVHLSVTVWLPQQLLWRIHIIVYRLFTSFSPREARGCKRKRHIGTVGHHAKSSFLGRLYLSNGTIPVITDADITAGHQTSRYGRLTSFLLLGVVIMAVLDETQ